MASLCLDTALGEGLREWQAGGCVFWWHSLSAERSLSSMFAVGSLRQPPSYLAFSKGTLFASCQWGQSERRRRRNSWPPHQTKKILHRNWQVRLPTCLASLIHLPSRTSQLVTWHLERTLQGNVTLFLKIEIWAHYLWELIWSLVLETQWSIFTEEEGECEWLVYNSEKHVQTRF